MGRPGFEPGSQGLKGPSSTVELTARRSRDRTPAAVPHLQLPHAQPPDLELLDPQVPDHGPPDRQAPDRERSDRDRAAGQRADRQRPGRARAERADARARAPSTVTTLVPAAGWRGCLLMRPIMDGDAACRNYTARARTPPWCSG